MARRGRRHPTIIAGVLLMDDLGGGREEERRGGVRGAASTALNREQAFVGRALARWWTGARSQRVISCIARRRGSSERRNGKPEVWTVPPNGVLRSSSTLNAIESASAAANSAATEIACR